MGCWNGTCGVTNTPIHDGEHAKLVLLHTKTFIKGSGACHTNEMYEPISFALSGIYDGYGSIELDDNDELNHLVYEMVCQRLGNIVTANNNIQDAQSLIESVCVGHVENVSFMLVHSNVWDSLTVKAGSYVPSYIYIQKNESSMSYRELLVDGYNTYIEPCPTAAKFDLYMPQTNVHTYFSDNACSKLMCNVKDLSSYSSGLLENAAVDLCLFDNVLTRTRKFWSPQSGQGSQESDYELLKMLCDHVIRLEVKYQNDIE